MNKRLLAFYAFVGNQLARVEMIERKSIRFLLREKLNREFPFGEITRRDGLEHIAAVEVLISAGPNLSAPTTLERLVEVQSSQFEWKRWS